MTDPNEMHQENLARFNLIEHRLVSLEFKVDTGIAVAKWIGGALVAILVVIAGQIWMHP